MIRQRTLYLEAQELSAYYRQGKHWFCDEKFTGDATSLERFAAYLRSHRRSCFRLLVDSAHEEIIVDTIPCLHGKDRQILIERKLALHFPHSLLRTALSLGYASTGRRDEKLALSAFKETSDLAPWLAQLAASESQISGIYSLSQLIGSVLGRQGKHAPSCLFFMQHGDSLREFFLVAGQPVLARSAPGKINDVAQEADKLQQYLLSQHRLARDEALPVFLLPPLEVDNNTENRPFEPLTLGIGQTRHSPFLDALAEHPPKTQFANTEQRKAFKLAKIRLAATLFASIFLLGSLPLSASKIATAKNLRNETGQWQNKEADLQKTARAQHAEPTPGQPPLKTLRYITDTYAELRRQQRLPRDAYVGLSHVLAQHPEIALESLDWQVLEGRETLSVQGRINLAGEHSPPSKLAAFEHFVAALRVDRDKPARVRQLPFNTDVSQGSDGAAPPSQSFIVDIGKTP